jgi:methionine-rich copper-binding protein CopC
VESALVAIRRSAACTTVTSLALLAGCAGSGVGLDENGRPLVAGGGGSGTLTADFASIQDHVFTPICSVCHAGGAAPQGLRLDATNSYSLLVGVPSTEVPSILRVKPGDPDNSYVIQKLEGHAAVGAQMPFGGPPLPAATIAVIRQWITDGAQPAPAAQAQAFATVAVTPAMHDVVLSAPARVVVEFSEELDQTRLDASSLRLEVAVRDGAAPTAVVPVTLRTPPGNARALIVEPAVALTDGVYRLVVPPAPQTGLSGVSGERLGARAAPNGGTVLTEFEVVVQP